MTIMAAACGILIVLLGLLSGGRNPTEVQSAIEITCLIGGLLLCFVAVVLARLTAIGRRLDAFEAVPNEALDQSDATLDDESLEAGGHVVSDREG